MKKSIFKKVKKITSLVLCSALILSLVGCSDEETKETASGEDSGANINLYEDVKASVEGSEEINELVAGDHSVDRSFKGEGVKSTINDKNKGSWGIYIYMCGSDLESQGGAATTDLDEMLEASLPENVQIVVEAGGAAAWQNEVFDAKKLNRFVINSEGYDLVDQVKNASMGKAKTLEDFVKFCNEKYPADNKMVVLWNHGGGSLGGACYDENFDGDHLTLNEIDKAFKNSIGKNKVNVIGFDCCLMATIDVAKICSKYGNMLIASEETEPGNGWYYTDFLNKMAKDPSLSNAELGKAVCDSFIKGCKAVGTNDETTLSAVDLTQVDTLVNALNYAGVELFNQTAEKPATVSKWGRAAKKAENYGGNNDSTGYFDMVDIGDLLKKGKELLPNTADYLAAALDQAVVYNVHGPLRKKSTGLSMFYPYDSEESSQQKYESVAASDIYAGFTRFSISGEISKGMTDLISLFIKEETAEDGSDKPEETAKPKPSPAAPVEEAALNESAGKLEFTNGGKDLKLKIDKKGYLSTSFGAENVDAIKSVYANVLYYDDESDILLNIGTDNDVNVNWDKGTAKDNFSGYWPCLGGNPLYLDIYYEGDDYNLYSVPIKLNGKKKLLTVAYYYDTDKYEVIGVTNEVDTDSANQCATKNAEKLKNGDKITFLYNYLDEKAEDWVEFEGGSMTYKKNKKVKYEDLGDGIYALMFITEDMKGNNVYSDYGYINYQDGEIEASLDAEFD